MQAGEMSASAQAQTGYPTSCECDALLANGVIIALRPIRPDDAAALVRFHDHLSGESVHRRFFGAHPHLLPAEVERFTCVDYDDRFALVAELDGCVAAVARYDRLPGSDRAEVAFVVADELHGQGVGTLLLEHLAAVGRHRGIATFFAETLAYNHPMVELFHRTGFCCSSRTSQGVIDLSFPIAPTERYLQCLTERHLCAVARWMGPGRETGLANPGVGVIAPCPPERSMVVAACGLALVGVSRFFTSDVAAATGQSDLLAYLASDAATEVVALELREVRQPRRFVAMARALAQRKPVLAFLAADADCPAELAALCEQAGVVVTDGQESLTRHIRLAVADVRAATWHPIPRGRLAEPDGCDISGACGALAKGWSDATAAWLARSGIAARRLCPEATLELLDAYGLGAVSPPMPGVPRGLRVTVSEGNGHPLAARIIAPGNEAVYPMTRVLPLSDLDAREVVDAAAPRLTAPGPLIDRVVRAARLVDDHPDIWCVNVALAGGDGEPPTVVWLGPPRPSDDDPFVSRLFPTSPQRNEGR
jgi:GNAT superfamily N-acetyltransferase